MKVAALFALLSLLLVGCGHHEQHQAPSADTKLRNALTGTWKQNEDAKHGDGLISLASDGTYWAQFNSLVPPIKAWGFEGKWTITNGFCVMTGTKARSWGTTNRVPDGRTDRITIITLDDQHLVWACDGQTNAFTREK